MAMLRSLVVALTVVAVLAAVPGTTARPAELSTPFVAMGPSGVEPTSTVPGTAVPPEVQWATLLFDPERTGANLAERTIAPSNVSQLVEAWTLPENGSDFSAPIVVNQTLFYGSWNGYEYAVDTSNGQVEWSRYLGIDNCGSYAPMGISSTPAYWNGTIFLGGGDGSWYALNATTGAIDWSYYVGAPPTVNDYDWASALVYRSWLYIGVASCFDNPLVRGALIQVNLTGPHTADHIFYTDPAGQIGNSIWTTPAVDPENNTIWVSTGNEASGYPIYANSIIGLNATNLDVLGSWQVPNVEGEDSDFGSTPTLYETAAGTPMVVATNKNGVAYALNRSNVSATGSWAPVWSLDTGGGFSSGAFDGSTLYLAGDALYAVNPATGAVLWENSGVSGVIAHLTWANGVVYAASADAIYAFDGQNGSRLWSTTVPGVGADIVAEPVVVNGRLYVASGNYSTEGNLTAYSIPLSASATASATSGTGTLMTNLTAQAHGGVTPYSFQWAFGDGGTGAGPSVSHLYSNAGNFTARVWVNDSAARSIEETVLLTVHPRPADNGLAAYIAAAPTSGVAPLTVVFNGSEKGGILPPFSYAWTFGDGTMGAGANVTHVYAGRGSFTVTLTVTDHVGNVATANVSVQATGPHTLLRYLEYGGIIGGGVAIAAVVGVLFWRRRRKKEPVSPPPDSS